VTLTVKPLAELAELGLHTISPILTPDDDFQRDKAAVKGGEFVPHVLAAELAALQFMEGVRAHCSAALRLA